jgi:hypothetical protein
MQLEAVGNLQMLSSLLYTCRSILTALLCGKVYGKASMQFFIKHLRMEPLPLLLYDKAFLYISTGFGVPYKTIQILRLLSGIQAP